MLSAKELWKPSVEFVQKSNLYQFQTWLKETKNLQFDNYQALWNWSVTKVDEFWESIYEYFDIIDYGSYQNVVSDDPMPYTKWFNGSKVNYAEHIFRSKTTNSSAILAVSENRELTSISWDKLESLVAKFADFLKSHGVKKGDSVVAFMPNIPEASIALLACMSIGAVWASCSPDFGTESIVDRFKQINPKVLIAVDGYLYNGKPYDKISVLEEIIECLTELETIVFVPFLNPDAKKPKVEGCYCWDEAIQSKAVSIPFEVLDFDHPIWVLYSSGTTGTPKAITHSHGGVLLEHLKYLTFHNDVKPGEVFFWFSTTGWMMWNFVHASLLVGATIMLYEGSPATPDLGVLWELAEKTKIAHFGTSAPFLIACMKAEMEISKTYKLPALRSIGSTGSPLPPEVFDYVYEKIASDVWLCSMSGGSDVCTAFVGGCPLLPVNEGEIQCRTLGCHMLSYDDNAKALVGEVGEMVVIKPMPSMPIYFWNDQDNERYLNSYFEHYPGIWRHGDWLIITDKGSLIILGRSDATLNRQGVRIGTSEIYRAMDVIPEVKDSLIVNLELEGGRHYMPLFVLLNEQIILSDDLITRIKKTLRTTYSPRHVPDEVIEVKDIPYTISGKKMEAPVKKILLGMPLDSSINKGSMRNPESISFFIEFAKKMK